MGDIYEKTIAELEAEGLKLLHEISRLENPYVRFLMVEEKKISYPVINLAQQYNLWRARCVYKFKKTNQLTTLSLIERANNIQESWKLEELKENPLYSYIKSTQNEELLNILTESIEKILSYLTPLSHFDRQKREEKKEPLKKIKISLYKTDRYLVILNENERFKPSSGKYWQTLYQIGQKGHIRYQKEILDYFNRKGSKNPISSKGFTFEMILEKQGDFIKPAKGIQITSE